MPPLSNPNSPIQRWTTFAGKRRSRNTNPNPLGGASILAISVASHTEQSIDLPGGGPNSQTHSRTVIAGDIILGWLQTEFFDPAIVPGGQYTPRATDNGKIGRQIVVSDGYSGTAGNRGFRCWIWTSPDIGTFNTRFWLDDTTGTNTPVTNANELSSNVIVFRNVASLILPVRFGALDNSVANRTGDGPFNIPSGVNELVIHGMNCSVVGTGTLSAGETIISDPLPATDISRNIISRKAGASPNVSVSSTGFTGTLPHPFQGMGFSLMPIGSAETRIRAEFNISGSSNQTPLSFSGAWTTPPSPRTTAVNLVSGKLQGSTAGENMARINTPIFGADGGIRARIAAGFSNFCWIAVRCQSGTSSTCYKLDIASFSSFRIEKMTDTGAALTYGALHADYSFVTGFVAGDYIELWITGGNLEIYYNQVLVDTVVDGTLVAGGFGTGVFGTGTSFDNIEVISGPRPRYP